MRKSTKGIIFGFSLAALVASAFAAEGPTFLSKPLLAGRASLTADGFVVGRSLGTANFTPELALDLEKHNGQEAPIEVEPFDRSHDRFLCIDDTVYHIGASLKDLGKKWFAFAKMELTTDELLTKI